MKLTEIYGHRCRSSVTYEYQQDYVSGSGFRVAVEAICGLQQLRIASAGALSTANSDFQYLPGLNKLNATIYACMGITLDMLKFDYIY